MIKKIALAAVLCSSIVFAAPAVDNNSSKSSLEELLNPNQQANKDTELKFIQSVIPGTKIDKFDKSIMDGFYNVYLQSGQILYVNPFKGFIFFGSIFDKNGYNYTDAQTKDWQNELMQKAIKNTPADQLTKASVKTEFNGGSKNNFAYVVFTDPECPYCQKLEEYLQTQKATVYINFFPLAMHKHGREWALKILSSKDTDKAFNDVIQHNIPNVKVTKEAEDTLKKMQDLGKKLNVQGTPRIYVIDVKEQKIVDIMNGIDAKKLEVYLNK